ncbi:MAG: aldehyde dehydrogenase family protein [Chromatiales bacterium]|nr:aldehyde dehydrogenase family protein [Chromatiales bacterium]
MYQQLFEKLHLPILKAGETFPSVVSNDLSHHGKGELLTVSSPIDGCSLGQFQLPDEKQVEAAIERASIAFQALRMIPAPRRGEFIRQLGNAFRAHKQELAELISIECGKILQESLGEVQEVIDICDLAVGQSRQLYGRTISSERPEHRMMEQWHPLGPVAVITAFNFPMAVWSWNATLAIICGDTLLWKPSEKAPLCAIACQQLINQVQRSFSDFPDHISQVIIGKQEVGQQLATSRAIPLVSATGSVPMGRHVATTVASRLGRSLLELGGNNGMIITPSADLDLALRAIVFAAVGTCGQRCTTLRRIIVHEDIIDEMSERLINSYTSLPIGNPLDEQTLIGPLIDERAYNQMQQALDRAQTEGGELLCGGPRIILKGTPEGYYVEPAIIKINANAPIIMEETFAPILYIIPYTDLDQAIAIHNNVPQGLSSAIFTNDIREAEQFLSVRGSDCGLANVNIGTSGAEIGGAFGGEKDTGGGRESGSDAWKSYMRRSTNTVNYGSALPLAQGINFGD